EDEFEARSEFTDPEILRTNLASVILQAAQLDLGDIANFPFLQPPDSRGVRDGLGLLGELGAIKDPKGKSVELTSIGKSLARLPIEPRFGRMLLESKKYDLVREVMIIVAGLTIQDPRERPLIKRQQADTSHQRFADPTSDFLSLLNLWNYVEKQQQKLSSSAFRRLCKAEYLNYLRVREWQDLIKQLRSIAKPLNIIPGNPKVDPDGIHKSLLSGLLSQIGLKQLSEKKNNDKSLKSEKPQKSSNEYLGSNGKKFVVFPGSTLAKKPPAAIMSAELVETSRLFARMNAAFNPEWAEELAGDLAKSSFSEPHWEKSQGAVVAYERVMLFGVPIVVARRMQYSRIDPNICRDLFIRHALVQGEWDSKQQFDRENQALLKKLEAMAEKSPKQMFAPDEEDVYHFYNTRIPADVISTRTFEGWWKKAKVETPKLLTMTREDLMPQDIKEVRDLPEFHFFAGNRFKLRYRFEPSSPEDGATVDVPLSLLAEIENHAFDWLVPEMREELVAELIRLLPKNLRRSVVPAADWAKKALAALPENPIEPLSATLAKTLRTLSGTHMTAIDFPLAALPTALRMKYRVIDENNRTLGLGLDLDALKIKLLPSENSVEVQKPTVDTRKQQNELAKEVLKLVPNPADYISEHLDKNEKLAIAAVGYRGTAAFVEDVIFALALEQIEKTGIKAKPQEIAQEITGGSVEKCFEIAKLIMKINIALRDANKSITEIQDVSLLFVLSNEKKHIGELMVSKLVSSTGLTQIARLPVYLQAIKIRMDKLVENSERDRLGELELNQALALYESALPEKRPAIRWLIEELRISLFAQTLGTTESVSVQRIKKALT
ncbi:MAG: DUF3418 domain-containing protein, partial [Actinobacteria bacterium]|nr:DUF3418 domain-containing protein [Actinomycetota bacterium]